MSGSEDETADAIVASITAEQQRNESRTFLSSLLNSKLRVHTTDQRMFWGDFKCTDPDSNIILSGTYEYRQPTAQQRARAAAELDPASTETLKMDMTYRYLGLIVVPGEHVVKIEKEDFASQLKGRK